MNEDPTEYTGTQLSLLWNMLKPDYTGMTISERFESFHKENPFVLEALAQLCFEVKKQGYDRWSIKAAYEVLRYKQIQTEGAEPYKLSNDFTSRYARKIIETYPQLGEDFFAFRELKTE
jgi:hypothetical protein